MAATYDPLPGLLQMSFGALVLLAVGALVLRWASRDAREAARARRWGRAVSELVGFGLGGFLVAMGVLMLLALPTEQREIRVAAFTEEPSGRTTAHFVHDARGRRTKVPDVSSARAIGSVYRCRIHHALVIGVDLGSCQPSDSDEDAREWRVPGR